MGNGSLLLVEEDPILADQVKEILRSTGIDGLAVVTSLKDAIQSIHEQHPDLVIIDDWFNHEIGAVEAALACHLNLAVPILHLIDYLEIPLLGRSHASQLCGYTPKPIRNRDFCKAVERSLQPKTAHQKLERAQPFLAAA